MKLCSVNFIGNIILGSSLGLLIVVTLYLFFGIDNFASLFIVFLTLAVSFSCYLVATRTGLSVSDPAFILSSFLSLYTIVPLFQNFAGVNIFAFNSIYNYSDLEVQIHALRFVFFNFTFCFLYFFMVDLFFKKQGFSQSFKYTYDVSFLKDDKFSLAIAFFILIVSFVFLSLMSAPVENYYDHYTKFDHLPGPLRSLVSVFKRLYWGILPIIVVLTLVNFRDKKIFAFFLLFILCAVDLIMSQGSRINTLLLVVHALVVYNLVVDKVNITKLFFIALPFVILMAAIELFRLSEGAVNLEELALIPGEFNALFFPSIELFKMQQLGEMPPSSFLMIFKDIYYLIPFLNNVNADPMNWYWTNFHPKAPVAPFTMGPVADSAFFGSWLAIFIRGLILSLNIFILRAILIYTKKSFVSLLLFTYCVSVSILVLKYSVFSYQEQVVKNLIPTLIIFSVLCLLIKFPLSVFSKKAT